MSKSWRCVATTLFFSVKIVFNSPICVTFCQEEELKALILYLLQMGDDVVSNNLKPYEMARQSPQVFWSLVKLYAPYTHSLPRSWQDSLLQNCCSPSLPPFRYGGDVITGLKMLLPDQSFDNLDARVRKLSEKGGEHESLLFAYQVLHFAFYLLCQLTLISYNTFQNATDSRRPRSALKENKSALSERLKPCVSKSRRIRTRKRK